MSVSASGDYGVVAATAGGEVVTLHGTLAVPILVTHSSPFGFTSNANWIISAEDRLFNNIFRGQVQKAGYTFTLNFTSVNVDTDWVIPNDFQEGPYFIRGQLRAGDDQPFIAAVGAQSWLPMDVIGTADNPANWFELINDAPTSFAEFRWRALAFPDNNRGTVKVDISSSTSEAGILATGYYRGETDIDSP